MATTLMDSVIHWKKKVEKNPDDDDVILSVIRKLSKIPITREILEETHIGRCIKSLSKRNDIVGEKATIVLNKWKVFFASLESVKNPKSPSVSKKGNAKKEKLSSNHEVSHREGTVYRDQKSSEKKHKHKKHSLLEPSSEKFINGDNSKESIHSLPKYKEKKIDSHCMDYDPSVEARIAYNPECPEFFPTDNQSSKIRKPALVDKYEPSPVKRKLKNKEQVETVPKKLKLNHSTSNADCTDKVKMSSEKKSSSSFQKDAGSSNIKKDSNPKSKNIKVVEHYSSVSGKTKNEKSKENSQANSSKSKAKVKINSSEEFTASSVSFEDCLGFNDIVSVKKKSSKSQSSAKKQSSGTVSNKTKHSEKVNCNSPVLYVKNTKETSSNDLKKKSCTNIPKQPDNKPDTGGPSDLPEIQLNYRPLPHNLNFSSSKPEKVLTNEDVIKFTSSRKEKTAIYSGKKNSGFTKVPSLVESCLRVLIENIDNIGYMGEVPYFLLKPVLARCSASQLYIIENYNPHLLEDTNELWELNCKRDYRLLKPREHETWRELYLRGHEEREKKLKSITANISASMLKSNPVRQVKLAYVDSFAKPPRDVARKQAKHGTALPDNQTSKAASPSKASPKPNATVSNSLAINKLSTTPTSSHIKVASPSKTNPKSTTPIVDPVVSSKSGNASLAPKKPKVAPLMAKTLKSMKQCFRR